MTWRRKNWTCWKKQLIDDNQSSDDGDDGDDGQSHEGDYNDSD